MNRLLAILALMTIASPLGAKPRPAVEHIGQPTLRGARLPFSEAVRVGDILFLSGQVGLRPDGALAPGFDAQARQAMANIGGVLAKAKLGWRDVAKCTVMLSDMANWPAFNKIYVTYFADGIYPARSVLGANGLALGAVVEVECIAYAPVK